MSVWLAVVLVTVLAVQPVCQLVLAVWLTGQSWTCVNFMRSNVSPMWPCPSALDPFNPDSRDLNWGERGVIAELISLSANTATCFGFRFVCLTNRGVVVGVFLFLSNLSMNMLQKVVICSSLNRADQVFLSILTPITTA